ncbi:hypothetical protein ORV05_34430 [Amycolatopsis cynarae]|uniref:Tetracyclin repressor-like C-terminal domain-containing protein n=1 Tax=Amycolatopsis cynarae TaxID=2995223 RepID=A0ABY7B2I5_9PSEU|nr:hypothetical protein [Amycolatopsis sp. HUAS 11-8]WAL65898.1 hypothetical protein ORV05_34430 [Amycolatopsis sp. HUAS 11-8]
MAGLFNLLLQTAVGRWVAQSIEERALVTFVREAFDQLCSTVARVGEPSG